MEESPQDAAGNCRSDACEIFLIGDIWVFSGQSNMEMGLGGCLGAADDIKAADLPMIRRIKFDHVQAAQPQSDAPAATQWQVCSSKTAGGFSGE